MSANNGPSYTDHIALLTGQAITAIQANQRGDKQIDALLSAFQACHDNLLFEIKTLPAPDQRDERQPWRLRKRPDDIARLATLWGLIDGFIRRGIREERKIKALAEALQRFKQNVLAGIEIDRDGQVFAEMNRTIAEVTDDPALIAWCERHGIKLLGEVLLIKALTKKEVITLRKIAADRHISADRLEEWVPTYAQDERILTIWKSEFPWVEDHAFIGDPHHRHHRRTVEKLQVQERILKDGGSELHAGMYMPISFRKNLLEAGKALREITFALECGVKAQQLEGQAARDFHSRVFAERGTNLLPRLVALRRPNALIVAIGKVLEEATVPDEEASLRHRKRYVKLSGWEKSFTNNCAHAGISTDRQLLMLNSPELFGEAAETISLALQLLGLKFGMTEDEIDTIFNS